MNSNALCKKCWFKYADHPAEKCLYVSGNFEVFVCRGCNEPLLPWIAGREPWTITPEKQYHWHCNPVNPKRTGAALSP